MNMFLNLGRGDIYGGMAHQKVTGYCIQRIGKHFTSTLQSMPNKCFALSITVVNNLPYTRPSSEIV